MNVESRISSTIRIHRKDTRAIILLERNKTEKLLLVQYRMYKPQTGNIKYAKGMVKDEIVTAGSSSAKLRTMVGAY